VDSSKYKIGPGDILNIRVWEEPQFSGPVAVHQDGKITMLLVGDLDVGGKTPIEAQDIVATALKKHVIRPLVTIIVQDVGSKKYFIDGLANHPGEYPLVTPTTVFEAISRASGLNEFANTKKIYVLRGDKRIRFNYHDVLRGKNMDQNILLQPGDHIVVP
jgi:polysaccharide biosynthesis/export protein